MNQREIEREVFQMLHRVQKPQALADLPLVKSMCRQTGERNPVAAVERVVNAALGGTDRKAAALKSVILGVDFERRATNGQAARQRGVSRRHFQRLRAQAVSAIARYASESASESQSHDATFSASHRESLWRSERERNAYIDARQRANAPQMRAISANLFRIAENRESRLSAAARLADANVRLGRIDEALGQGDLAPSARLVVEAQRALLDGKPARAHALVKAAARTLRDAEDRFNAALFEARLSIASPDWLSPDMQTSWGGLWGVAALAAERARHLLRTAPLEAVSLALTTWRQAVAHEYNGVAARCAATLCEAAHQLGDNDEKRRWRARAIERLVLTSDVTIAATLFGSSVYSIEDPMDDALCATLYERLSLIVPQMQGESGRQHAAVRSLIAATVDTALSAKGCTERLERAVASVARSDSAFAHYAQSMAHPVSEMLALALVGLSGRPWSTVLKPTTELVGRIAERLRPIARRTFPIVLPHWRSQSGLADHLRNDELTGLRVRFVPVRSVARSSLTRQLRGTAPGKARQTTATIDSR